MTLVEFLFNKPCCHLLKIFPVKTSTTALFVLNKVYLHVLRTEPGLVLLG
jgi:hypothetical protein